MMRRAPEVQPDTAAILTQLREATGPSASFGQHTELHELAKPLQLGPATSPLLTQLAQLALGVARCADST